MRAGARSRDDVEARAREGRIAVTHPLSIATYNVHRYRGRDGRADPQRTATVIRELACDVVGLQEVDNDEGDAPESLRLDFLAAATGMTAIAGLRLIRHIGRYGNALLTRLPVLAVKRHDLSYSRFEPRGALEVELQAGAQAVHIIVTHLGLVPWERRHQTRKILQIVAAIPAAQPVILLGDINEWLPRGRPLRWLHALFGCPPSARSFPSAYPLFALDRIWVKPREILASVQAHRSAAARMASDHLPVKAVIDVPT